MSALAHVLPASSLMRPQAPVIGATLGGIPRGALTEIAGPPSSGRTSLLCALLAEATVAGEFCALIDVDSTFDPASAAAAGVRLSQLMWVRCASNVEHALKAADMLAQGGGFGLVAIDLADTPQKFSRRVPMAAWFRLRHAVTNTKTALLSVGSCFNASTCSAVKIELARDRAILQHRLLEGIDVAARIVVNHQSRPEKFIARR